MNIYRDTLVSNSKSLNAYGSMYTLCKEQNCESVVDVYLSGTLTYDACYMIKKALHKVVLKDATKSMLYVFTDSCFSKFETLASEDSSVATVEGKEVQSVSVLSNLLFTTDNLFFAEDIPKLNKTETTKYNKGDMYIVRLLHKLRTGGEQITSEDIVVYVPTRYTT